MPHIIIGSIQLTKYAFMLLKSLFNLSNALFIIDHILEKEANIIIKFNIIEPIDIGIISANCFQVCPNIPARNTVSQIKEYRHRIKQMKIGTKNKINMPILLNNLL